MKPAIACVFDCDEHRGIVGVHGLAKRNGRPALVPRGRGRSGRSEQPFVGSDQRLDVRMTGRADLGAGGSFHRADATGQGTIRERLAG